MGARDVTTHLVGKRGELFVFHRLLDHGVVPYVPLIDVEGVDCLVRKRGGGCHELQIRVCNTPKTPCWWNTGAAPDRVDYFFVLLEPPPFSDGKTWVVPAAAARAHVTGSGSLDLGRPGELGIGAERRRSLEQCRGNWDQLVSGALIVGQLTRL